eukprot:TRINITY_DN41675_c0_g1_i1.p1 TRINITY_DN41675_c0_g1~~TRINITY_DN41675_c0_g1_i1.p1  ORF type:complete len:424 (-),score=75.24 TRINITY_DN41675_c0_g1_i1:25-1296(-)
MTCVSVGDTVSGIGPTRLDGTVRFVGTTHFADGEWVGVELDQPVGKNDGFVKGVRYFSCRPFFGVFVRKHTVTVRNARTCAANISFELSDEEVVRLPQSPSAEAAMYSRQDQEKELVEPCHDGTAGNHGFTQSILPGIVEGLDAQCDPDIDNSAESVVKLTDLLGKAKELILQTVSEPRVTALRMDSASAASAFGHEPNDTLAAFVDQLLEALEPHVSSIVEAAVHRVLTQVLDGLTTFVTADATKLAVPTDLRGSKSSPSLTRDDSARSTIKRTLLKTLRNGSLKLAVDKIMKARKDACSDHGSRAAEEGDASVNISERFPWGERVVPSGVRLRAEPRRTAGQHHPDKMQLHRTFDLGNDLLEEIDAASRAQRVTLDREAQRNDRIAGICLRRAERCGEDVAPYVGAALSAVLEKSERQTKV